MENVNNAIYQFLGAVLFMMAVSLFYYMDTGINREINYRVENLHKQKAVYIINAEDKKTEFKK